MGHCHCDISYNVCYYTELAKFCWLIGVPALSAFESLFRKRNVTLPCLFLAGLYESTIALAPALASVSGLTKMLKFYVKVFKSSYFLNPLSDGFTLYLA